MENVDDKSDRRKFLKLGALAGGVVLLGAAISKAVSLDSAKESGEKVKILTADGKLMEVDSCHMKHPTANKFTNQEMRKGISGKKFVMVIDLSRCANARKCIEGCQSMHHKQAPTEWIKVKRMEDSEAPY
jgi:molybdopterin-containing oxidoreductase family iron-sulfur binding subunit